MSLQDLQAPIDHAIVESMIESTPESWRQITLTLERAPHETQVGALRHSITSPEGHPPVLPADSLFAATYQLDELFQRHNALFSRAVYEVTVGPESSSWRSEFQYLRPPSP